jgi:hypothetical protein
MAVMHTSAPTEPAAAPPLDPAAPRRPARFYALLAAAAAACYGALQGVWQLAGPPVQLSPIGPDLLAFHGWRAVALCGVAVVAALLLATLRLHGAARIALLAAAGAVSAALVTSGAMLVLDLVGLVFFGLGPTVYPLGALSRALCIGTGLAMAAAAVAYWRVTSRECRTCGRGPALARLRTGTPPWAYIAAYTAVAAFAARLLAQVAVGWGENPMTNGASAIAFLAAAELAGTVLPLALVHSWGRIWPRWTPGLAGRRVPRWLVLGPGIGVSGGLITYFGFVLAQMVRERLNGRSPFGDLPELPEAFFWVAVPAYWIWGVALAFAAYSYHHRTRRACPTCTR